MLIKPKILPKVKIGSSVVLKTDVISIILYFLPLKLIEFIVSFSLYNIDCSIVYLSIKH